MTPGPADRSVEVSVVVVEMLCRNSCAASRAGLPCGMPSFAVVWPPTGEGAGQGHGVERVDMPVSTHLCSCSGGGVFGERSGSFGLTRLEGPVGGDGQ